MQPAIERAVSTVGQGDPHDWSMRPTGFAALYSESAPALAAVLEHSSLGEIARNYEENDSRAVAAQERFVQHSRRASWCILITAIAGALLASSAILLQDSGPDPEVGPTMMQRVPLWILAAISMVSGVIGGVTVFVLESERMLADWMTSRAEAEAERIAYFAGLAERAQAESTEVQLLALEHFRRYQSDVQRAYYTGRGNQHRLSHSKTTAIGAVAIAILTLSAGAGGLLGALQPEWLSLAALGAIGAALAAFSSRRAELTQDGRNAERYRRTAGALGSVAKTLSDVREGVAGGRPELLTKFVDAINEQVSLEHRQWMEQREALDAAANDLHAALRAGK